MKAIIRPFLGAVLLATIGLVAGVASAERASAAATEKTIYVGPQRVACEGMGPQLCYQVKETLDGPWTLFYWDIEGFKYEAGYTYQLRVEEVQLVDRPADGPGFEWTLLEVVAKRPTGAVPQNSPGSAMAPGMPRTGGSNVMTGNIVLALLSLCAVCVWTGVLIAARPQRPGHPKLEE
ncbi:MAG TPA: DUF4377 domain-containing protein [Chloroflexia bacterium]|nr:DUF4377 domain-containing protein [Chloroflexia bacterium]